MIPKEILNQVRKIEISTKSLVNELFSGEYHSIFKGQGLEFSEVRAYQPGDNVKLIDWNVSARFGHPYIKKFEETRELTVMLIIDVSQSGEFGTKDKLKREIAAEIGAILAFSAIKNNDKVGLILFSESIELYIPPKKGKNTVLRIVREILYHTPEHKKTDISNALEYYYKMSKKRSIIFLLSDFFDENYFKTLQIIAQKHDVVAIRILDPKEFKIPHLGFINFQDTETGEEIFINTKDRKFKDYFQNFAEKRITAVSEDLKKLKIDLIDIQSDMPYINTLVKFFKKRARRIK
ncbi:MAG: DUF58 domain-containing protein [Candidatus Cloacimonetes bacterium]|nr:DUF58 domain-containing protein [Candidatus Cloacimonadota bacterium]MBL7085676.1 DUF58 domain-containing protein [Candidatus Cloacimonadota bacterium]